MVVIEVCAKDESDPTDQHCDGHCPSKSVYSAQVRRVSVEICLRRSNCRTRFLVA